MTTEKMPDVVNLDWYALQEALQNTGPFTRYIRAEPVEHLLKQVRDQIEFCKKHDHAPALDKTMMLIDKFLGDK